MRIFYASNNTPCVYGVPESKLWFHNLYGALVDLGHDVIYFDYDMNEHFKHVDISNDGHKRFIEKNRPNLEQDLIRQIIKAHKGKKIDLFFSYFFSAIVRPEVIREIRNMGIVTVNWFCNASYQFHLIKDLAPAYDYCLVAEKYRLDDYIRVGANPIYCQEAANPNIYKPYPLNYEYDVTFVGQKYGDRPGFVTYIYEQGIDIHVFGPNWKNSSPESWNKHSLNVSNTPLKRNLYQRLKKHTPVTFARVISYRIKNLMSSEKKGSNTIPDYILGPPLSDEEMIKLYSRSKINLGFSACAGTDENGQRILQIRLRDFEVPMSGGFYMVEYQEELEEFFEIGKEIVCYHNKEDLTEKIEYYLAHDDEREAIRKAGYERARKDHTWQKRFQSVFEKIGMSI